MTRPRHTDAQLRRFIALARGGRDNRADVLDAMRRHPAGKRPRTPRPDHPPMTDADGTPADPLPTTEPED
ncbi:hypothetical protein KZX18_06185 [Micrococcus luteus]|uniref:hypothetical protein n=1 Tax=Micrococcus luteus TaxID=1270 RepID=UPI002005F1F0|nr:hypothetical protein [Micrococcus luteus]MCK6109551.1 hypothetical protein [Micrococcus luteus]